MNILAGIVLERLGDAALLLDAVELEQEIGMEEIAAEFAVGHGLEAEIFLPLDKFGDGRVLDRAQFGIIDIARGAVLSGLDHAARTEERADMVGAGRQFGGHVGVFLGVDYTTPGS